MTPPRLIPLCTVDLTLDTSLRIGDGPQGHRVIAPVTAMAVRGERLTASLVGTAYDWLIVANGVATVDVRATVRTDDGALIFVRYTGRSDAGGGVGAADFFVAPVFETGDPRYRWLNCIQAVGRGNLAARHYDWYELG